ncbi:hypothetical protein ST47_g6181 [Ascochyta rabiei]|uniref:Uncharacterized protein n=1 Tax=Didymella rabiei TaxID=5454 RepID=A0A163CM73_DIDRA|nr:hypothetical protein ST47_g6181 [Ascochyta rabiei]
MDSTIESVPLHSTPHVIMEDCDDSWRVCFEPDIAGIITEEPRSINKTVISYLYPHLVEAWDAQVAEQETEAQRIEQTFLAFMRRFNDDKLNDFALHPPQPAVACDQHLLPGMSRHWGELRPCATHPQDDAPFRVCKGCRVSHQMQWSGWNREPGEFLLEINAQIDQAFENLEHNLRDAGR